MGIKVIEGDLTTWQFNITIVGSAPGAWAVPSHDLLIQFFITRCEISPVDQSPYPIRKWLANNVMPLLQHQLNVCAFSTTSFQ